MVGAERRLRRVRVPQFECLHVQLQRQADVVLRQRTWPPRWSWSRSAAGRAAAGAANGSRVREAVQHRGHPPGEVLHPPDPAQARAPSSRRAGSVPPVAVPGRQRRGEHAHVGDREVQPLGAGGRHDVGGVAGEEQPAVAASARPRSCACGVMPFSRIGPSVEAPAVAGGQPASAAPPRSGRPARRSRSSSGRHLEVEPGDRRASACCAGRTRARGTRRSARRTTAAPAPGCPARRTGSRARRSVSTPAGIAGGRPRGSRRSRR